MLYERYMLEADESREDRPTKQFVSKKKLMERSKREAI